MRFVGTGAFKRTGNIRCSLNAMTPPMQTGNDGPQRATPELCETFLGFGFSGEVCVLLGTGPAPGVGIGVGVGVASTPPERDFTYEMSALSTEPSTLMSSR